ncbi:MAG: PKD domain-containing protein, partial [Candidatus Aenigmarchaeota archaeon]|nr:PKD domain-containing protein [Candidatus Aenigmarchaeota archaeon]
MFYYADTWEYDDEHGWQKINTVGPSGRYGFRMVFDEARGKVVLFGGDGCDPNKKEDGRYTHDRKGTRGIHFKEECGDTWEYDVNTKKWELKHTSHHPPTLHHYAMAYDSKRNVTVLFGGYSKEMHNKYNLNVLDDTWEYDGTDWRKVNTLHSPPGLRKSPDMVYDSKNGKMILFGGSKKKSPNSGWFVQSDELWEYDGHDWKRIFYGTIPPSARIEARIYHAMAYDSKRNRVVLFGGYHKRGDTWAENMLDDTWEYNPDTREWKKIEISPHPSARDAHRMIYDSKNGRVILFGGAYSLTCVPGIMMDIAKYCGDMWEYIYVNVEINTSWPLQEGKEIIFDGSGSSYGGKKITQYCWDFGDGNSTCLSQSKVTHVYNKEGTYTVMLEIETEDGSKAKGSKVIGVGVGPVAKLKAFAENREIEENGTVEVNHTIMFDPSYSEVYNPLVSCVIDFGDGEIQDCGGLDALFHKYKETGTYYVTLTLKDSKEYEDSTTFKITIVPQKPPVAAALDYVDLGTDYVVLVWTANKDYDFDRYVIIKNSSVVDVIRSEDVNLFCYLNHCYYDVSNLKPNEYYEFTIRTYDKDNLYNNSNTKVVRTYLCEPGSWKLCDNAKGICTQGSQECKGYYWTECSIQPSVETCNGIDDDCDGIIDNVNGGSSVEETRCGCYNGSSFGYETCNGIDDDCDGIIDNVNGGSSVEETRCGCYNGSSFGYETCNGIDD